MIVRVIAAIVLAAAVAAGAAYWFLTSDVLVRELERQATAWLGQPVRIGDASVGVWPRITLQLDDVEIGDPARVRLPDVDLEARLRPLLSRDVIAGLVRDGQLVIERAVATAGDMTLETSGTVTFSPRIEAVLKARADRLDAAALVGLAAGFATAKSPPATDATAPRVTVDIQADEGTIAGVAVRRIAGTLRSFGRDLSIEPLTFDVFGGRHNGWFDVALGDQLDVRLGASVSNIDAAQLAAFGGAGGALTGRLGGSVRLGGRAANLDAVLRSLRGSGEVVVSNGTLRGLDLVQTVVNVLGRTALEPRASGTPFERIAGTFALSDGRVRSDDLTLHSTDFDIFARGTLRLDTDALDGEAQVVLSEALSAQANRQVFRYAETDNRILLPATVGGTLQGPQVRFDTRTAVRQAIGNEIKRRLSELLVLQ